uniref:Uncharacterized protein n=1 Tax=Coccidioides posadasii RMSCC 3488 TaxID=454284 RepID=A0A0J6FCJ6_COCPO|nr:hypothetical protein CPAG_02957 [Coccidioides posadasii RMSCC 3488]
MGINEEEILSISIGPHQWYSLEAELDPGEAESFPKFLYDPSTSQLSVEDALISGKRMLILEVVLAGTYDHLVKSAKLWLEGKQDVQRVLLVELTDGSEYHCPIENPPAAVLESLALPTRGPGSRRRIPL